ncbi:hypothetical protein [sulfur-oxidizing endosymbiont of Gigantopelta aegis]|uniref:hypothetical protein n=1 Tax=sulfur-oxidizing endosymbiont of Gigantopelta aegis TaxID=2794934 RepID=UPI0018DBBDB9|nr:hypothetical protein [sulfur-oxidizing endosymbiont of Gigantopelta aegis]
MGNQEYILDLEDSVFSVQGYDKRIILEEIKTLKTTKNFFFKDRFDYFYSLCIRYLKLNLFFGKNQCTWARNRFLS